MNIVYRTAKIDDYEGIYYVSCYSWEETYRGFMPDDYLDDRINNYEERSLRTKKYLEQLEWDDELENYLVCEVDGKIVGICQYSRTKSDSYADSGLLGALYVLKDYQGLGIGKELFRRAVVGLMNMGYKTMYLECLVGNKSIEFYKKYGGQIIEVVDYPISDFTVKAEVVYYDHLRNLREKLK